MELNWKDIKVTPSYKIDSMEGKIEDISNFPNSPGLHNPIHQRISNVGISAFFNHDRDVIHARSSFQRISNFPTFPCLHDLCNIVQVILSFFHFIFFVT